MPVRLRPGATTTDRRLWTSQGVAPESNRETNVPVTTSEGGLHPGPRLKDREEAVDDRFPGTEDRSTCRVEVAVLKKACRFESEQRQNPLFE